MGIIENQVNKNYHNCGETFYKNTISAPYFWGSETRTEEIGRQSNAFTNIWATPDLKN